ncbi:CorA family divalent cation transporter [Flavobacterium johnsoniae]|uniref:CorA family divalent cation transporter n=1 Tax=Flavobacterium johnsoniae TaxID=986 RepID=UPI000933F7BE|nr:Loki-CTERM sorting domain-containing protein [Flavobacterium johnsoniae]
MLLYDQVQEDANNLLNIYLSLSARKTNDVMKLLTIFSVFFMPLTFIVGIYGMNFRYMPELESPLGYPLTMLVMVLVCGVIFFWFKRKKWLSTDNINFIIYAIKDITAVF